MATVEINNLTQQIEDYTIARLKAEYPNTDTSSSSPIIDLIVKPQTFIAEALVNAITKIEVRQLLSNADTMDATDLDEIGEGNYMTTRLPGEYAIGTATFKFISISDTQATVIPAGVIVSTSAGLKFKTVSMNSFTPAEMYSKWDNQTMSYNVDISVQSEIMSESYNIDPGQIVSIDTTFSSYPVSAINIMSFSGGKSPETNAQYEQRIRKFLSSRTLETDSGYAASIKETFPEVKDVYVAGKGNALMTRDLAELMIMNGVELTDYHIGGKVDIYIRGTESGTGALRVMSMSNVFVLERDLTVNIVNDQTISNVRDVTTNTSGLPYATWIQKFDDNTVRRCIAVLSGFSDGDTIEISWTSTGGSSTTGKVTGIIDCGQHTYDPYQYRSYELSVYPDIAFTSTPKVPVLSQPTNYYNATKRVALPGNINNDVAADSLMNIFDPSEGTWGIPGSDSEYADTLVSFAGYKATLAYVNGLIASMGSGLYVSNTASARLPFNGDVIEGYYSYNKTIRDAGDYFNTDENRVVTRDVLCRTAVPFYFIVHMNVALKQGVTEVPLLYSSISETVDTYLSGLAMGAPAKEAELASKIMANAIVAANVDYLYLPFDAFMIVEPGAEGYTIENQGPMLSIPPNRYFEAGVVEMTAVPFGSTPGTGR